MPVPKRTAVPPEKLLLYQRLRDSVQGVESKSNFGSAYTAVNGNMYQATVFRADPAWPPAKEYVAVPDDLLADTDALTPYLEASYRYALALRPKATKKRSASIDPGSAPS